MSYPLKKQNEVSMAQLCFEASEMVKDDTYKIHVFANDPSDNSNNSWGDVSSVELTEPEFVELFYGNNNSGDSEFTALVEDGNVLNKWYSLLDASYMQFGREGVRGVDFTDEVVNIWTSNCKQLSTCSELSIRAELIKLHNFKKLANCKVCCSLTYGELVDAVASAKADGNGTTRTGADRILTAGDRVSLNILLKQSYPGTQDVEIVIHYQIKD